MGEEKWGEREERKKKGEEEENESFILKSQLYSISGVITISRSTWMTTKIKMESPPIFFVRV